MLAAGSAPVAIIALLLASLTLASCSNPAAGATAEEGSESNPHLIDSAADLDAMRGGVTDGWDLDDFYKLTADIDLASYGDWTPIGSADSPFTGTLDGNGHEIMNLTINSPVGQHHGLFGDIGNGGKIHDLGLTSAHVSGYAYVGGFVGYNGGTITDCYSTGNATGTTFVGGFVGYNGGTITDCYSTGVASGSTSTGGFAGYNGGTITDCYSEDTTSGTSEVGGFVGLNDGTITDCYSTGYISGTGGGVGGVVGVNNGTITDCYSTGNVSAASVNSVGGFVGWNYQGTITDCYSTGYVSGYGWVGGFAGGNESGTITNCYSSGAVNGADDHVGGFVGGVANGGTIIACFYDSTISGLTDSDRGSPKTTAEMKTLSTFTAAGWDFVGEATNGTADIWDLSGSVNSGYPYLVWQEE